MQQLTSVLLEERIEADKKGKSRPVVYTSTNKRVSCHERDCKLELHCFYTTEDEPEIRAGLCQGCGRDLIDWDRHRQRNPGDLEYTVEALQREWIRHLYWTCVVDPETQRMVRMRGCRKLLEMFRAAMTSHLAQREPFRDGWAVAYNGDPIHYIRHATASCCRRCASYWHGIEMAVEMPGDQIDYLVALAERFILERFPDCSAEPDPTYRKGGINSNQPRVSPGRRRRRQGRVLEP